MSRNWSAVFKAFLKKELLETLRSMKTVMIMSIAMTNPDFPSLP